MSNQENNGSEMENEHKDLYKTTISPGLFPIMKIDHRINYLLKPKRTISPRMVYLGPK